MHAVLSGDNDMQGLGAERDHAALGLRGSVVVEIQSGGKHGGDMIGRSGGDPGEQKEDALSEKIYYRIFLPNIG